MDHPQPLTILLGVNIGDVQLVPERLVSDRKCSVGAVSQHRGGSVSMDPHSIVIGAFRLYVLVSRSHVMNNLSLSAEAGFAHPRKIVGMVSRSDLLKPRAQRLEDELKRERFLLQPREEEEG